MEAWEFLEAIKHAKEVALGEATINSDNVTIRSGKEFVIEYHQGELTIDVTNDLKNLIEMIYTINKSISLIEIATKVTTVNRIVIRPNTLEIELETENSDVDIEYTMAENRAWPEIRAKGRPDNITGELLFLKPFIEYFDKREGKIIETSTKAVTGITEVVNIPTGQNINVGISRTHDKDISVRVNIDNVEFSLSYPDYSWLDTGDLTPAETLILGLNGCYDDCSKEEFNEALTKLTSLVEKIMKIPREYDVVLLSITGGEPQFILTRNTKDIYLMTTSTDVVFNFTKNADVQNVINIISDAKNILKNFNVENKNLDKILEVLEEHKDSFNKGEIWFSPETEWDELELDYFSEYRYSKIFSNPNNPVLRKRLTIPINGADAIPREFVTALSLLKDVAFSITAKTNGAVSVSLRNLTVSLSINEDTVDIELIKAKEGADKELKMLKRILRDKGYKVKVTNPEFSIAPRLNIVIMRMNGSGEVSYTIEANEWNRDYALKAVFKLPNGEKVVIETWDIKTKELTLKIPKTSLLFSDTLIINLRSGIFEYLRDNKVIRRGLIPFYMISEQ